MTKGEFARISVEVAKDYYKRGYQKGYRAGTKRYYTFKKKVVDEINNSIRLQE